MLIDPDMAKKIDKTNVARLLDKAKIAYELIPYTVDEDNLAATHVAEELGEDIATVRGGCSPIGMKRALPTIIDHTALLHERIYISAGVRGLQVALSPKDLIDYVDATVAPVTTKDRE